MKYILIFTICLIGLACSRASKDQIIGRWEFEKFEVSDNQFQLADSLKEMRNGMEKANRGLIFSFQENGELNTYRTNNNSETFVSKMMYKFQGKNIIILQDSSDGSSARVNIHQLTNTTLKISFEPNNYDIGVFKKTKR